MFSKKDKLGFTAFILISSAMFTSCGASRFETAPAPGLDPQPIYNGNPGTGGNGGGGTISSGPPAPNTNFQVTGFGGTQPNQQIPQNGSTLPTDSILRVRVHSGPGGPLAIPQYSNFQATYYCASYTVTALQQDVNGNLVQMGAPKTTQLLSVNGGSTACYGAPTEQILDFSDRLYSGHGNIAIQVAAAAYDYYCVLYSQLSYIMPGGVYLYCPQHSVYKNHTVTGSVDIQTNGYSLN